MTITWMGCRLGQRFACLSILRADGRAEVIANEDGDRQTPVAVAFSEEGEGNAVTAGTQAFAQWVRQPNSTCVAFPGLLTADEEKGKALIEDSKATAPYIFKDQQWQVQSPDGRWYTAHQLNVIMLKRLKQSVESYLGREVTGVVMTVPGPLSNAWEKVASEAGFKQVQLLPEDVAVVLAYDQIYSQPDLTCLVVNGGASQFTLSLVARRQHCYTVLESVTESSCSGLAYDEALLQVVAAEYAKSLKRPVAPLLEALHNDKRAHRKLLQASESTKRELSTLRLARCTVDALIEGLDCSVSVQRSRFALTAKPLTDKIVAAVKRLQTVAKIDAVLLVGGAVRMPVVSEAITRLFEVEQQETTEDENAEPVLSAAFWSQFESDEVAALGAASYALRVAHTPRQYKNTTLLTVNAELALETGKDQWQVLVPLGTPIHSGLELSLSLPDGANGYLPLRLAERRSSEWHTVLQTSVKLTSSQPVRLTAQVLKSGVQLNCSQSDKSLGQWTIGY